MAISHELSSEIAAALFTDQERSPRERKALKEMILVVHSTLQQFTDDARTARIKRLKSRSAPDQFARGKSAFS